MASPGPKGDTVDAPAFPQDPAEFDSDPRISFSMLDNKFILETDDGQEFEYDTGIKRWVQKVCGQSRALRISRLWARWLGHDLLTGNGVFFSFR
jgi:hypothetical protein